MAVFRAQIVGMHCASCVGTIEHALRAVPGVSQVSVNLATGDAKIEYDSTRTRIAALLAAVENSGYEAIPQPNSPLGAAPENQGAPAASLRVVVALTLATLTVILTMSGAPSWAALLAATPVQFWCGWPFLAGMARAARHRHATMDTLVGLGTLSAYLFSLAVTLYPERFASHDVHATYYEISAFLVGFILLGQALEGRARRRAGTAIRNLLRLFPNSAHVLRDGQETDIRAEDVAENETLVIRPGERIAADGTILDGMTAVDESMLTGESIPVDKAPGAHVTAGTVNQTGALRVRATAVGAHTTLAKIIELVREAQSSQAPIQRYADQVSAVFVPIVIGLAALTFVCWMLITHDLPASLLSTVSVLIIACPCALGLATPAAIIVGIGRASELGILVRNATALEILQRARVFIFDKTGTLTLGKPEMTDFELIADVSGSGGIGDLTETEALRLIASAESSSEHPLARSVVAAARARGIRLSMPTGFVAVPGQGLRATVEHRPILVGTREFLLSRTIAVPEAVVRRANVMAATGKTVVLAAIDRKLAALIALADTVRPEAQAVIRELHRQGMRTVLLSGDREATAAQVARLLGIGEVHAGVSPLGKAAKVRELAAQGEAVMIGDGINDAPALAAAQVGIAMGSGTDVAIDTASITLLRRGLEPLLDCVALSRQTFRTIRQNLFASFFYNAAGIPIAAGLLHPWTGWRLSPMLAGGAMALSSVSVVLNSLRLRRWKPPRLADPTS